MGWQVKGGVGRRMQESQAHNSAQSQDVVLVVAEDQATRQSLIDVLGSADIEAVGATAAEALAIQGQVRPAVALVEHVWRASDGVALSASLKDRDPEIQVLLLTDPESLDTAQPASSVDGYLVKPLAAVAFVQTVKGAFSHHALAVANRDLAGARERRERPEETMQVTELPEYLAASVGEPAAATAPSTVARAPSEPSFVEAPAEERSMPVSAASTDETHTAETHNGELPNIAPVLPSETSADMAWTVSPISRGMRPRPEPAAVAPAESLEANLREDVSTRAAWADNFADLSQVDMDDELRHALTLPAPVSNAAGVFLVQLHLPAGYEDDWYRHSSAILARIQDRLASGRRRSDTVTPIGDGRFVVVCADVATQETAELIAAPMVRELSRPLQIAGTELPLAATLGIVLAHSGEGYSQAPEALLEDATLALRLAGEEGRPWTVFDDSVGGGIRLRARIERAMENGELGLDFQKVVDLQTRQIVGAEALLRWRRPGREVLRASEFLPEAWEAGLGIPLGRWVLDHALGEMAAWRDRGQLAEGFRLSVNVSAEEVTNPEFSEMVEKLLRGHGVPPTMLSLEMPESALGDAASTAHAVRGLHALRELGVDCVVDDFGTGRSNLDWLQELPVTGLKITPALVSALDRAEDRRGPALVRGVIALGHELQMMVVGEGVESESEAVALRAMGCDLAQGHYVGQPERPEELAAALAL